MDKSELLAIFDREQRIELKIPGITQETTGRVIRHHSPHEHSGFIAYFDLDEASVEAEIDAQVAFFAALGVPFEWKVYDHDRPADIRQRLAARGFEIEDPEALMVLDMDEAPDFYEAMALPDSVMRFTGPAEVEEIVRLEMVGGAAGARSGKHP